MDSIRVEVDSIRVDQSTDQELPEKDTKELPMEAAQECSKVVAMEVET